ncbi:MAG: hypothetical protein HYV07_00820 [Deltaproteobacteria bacterium]|nr:hypothetical protein [Deltaproteobacteria bacterium]
MRRELKVLAPAMNRAEREISSLRCKPLRDVLPRTLALGIAAIAVSQSACESRSLVAFQAPELEDGSWLTVLDAEGEHLEVGLSRVEGRVLLELGASPDRIHVLAFSDSEIRRHQPSEEALAKPLQIAGPTDPRLPPAWTRTFDLRDGSTIAVNVPSVTAPWVADDSRCSTMTTRTLVPFGSTASFVGREPSGPREPAEYQFDEVIRVDAERALLRSASFLILMERGSSLVDRRSHVVRLGEFSTAAGVSLASIAVGPADANGEREVLLGTQGAADSGVYSLPLTREGLGLVRTSTIFGAAVKGLGALEDGRVLAAGDLLAERSAGGVWRRIPAPPIGSDFSCLEPTPDGVFMGTGNGLILNGPDLDHLSIEPLLVGRSPATSPVPAISSAKTPTGLEVWAATLFNGLFRRTSEGGEFEAITVRAESAGVACAGSASESGSEVGQRLHNLVSAPDGTLFIVPRDCTGLYVLPPGAACAGIVTIEGETMERSAGRGLRGVHYGDHGLTVSGLGELYVLGDRE